MASEAWRQPEQWDVIVVGSGAVGGWAALQLGQLGLRVLVLEAGHDGPDAPITPRESEADGKRAIDRILRRRKTQARHSAYWELDPDSFVVDADNPYEVAAGKPFDWIRTRQLNGRLLTWGGICVRISDHELAAPEQDGFGAPWPLRYADLSTHYDRIDDFWPVYGEHDGLPQLPDGKYAGACHWTDAERRFQKSVAEQALGPQVIAARGVLVRPLSRPSGEAPPPSPVRAAVARFGVTVRTDSVVSHVTVDGQGHATGVAFVDRTTKQHHEVRARAVAVCASTLESTRILLHSTSRHHPRGLGNSSGALGKYLMDHPAIHLTGFVPGERGTPWTDGYSGPKNIMIPRFHNLANRAGGAFLRGWGAFGHIGRWPAPADCGPSEVALSLVGYGEMLPRIENHVRLVPEVRDAWGIPALHIDCQFSQNELAMQQHMEDVLSELVEHAGGRVKEVAHLVPGAFVHEMGTARMGSEPQTSVLNSYAQCWDAPNVFVMDGAAWPSGAWQNPTVTMMAIAGRACEHLASELKRS